MFRDKSRRQKWLNVNNFFISRSIFKCSMSIVSAFLTFLADYYNPGECFNFMQNYIFNIFIWNCHLKMGCSKTIGLKKLMLRTIRSDNKLESSYDFFKFPSTLI